MTLNEFKAWFEGFSETMDGAPNEKQWERIKTRVGEINGSAISYPIFVDRYVRPYRDWYSPSWVQSQATSRIDGVTWMENKSAKSASAYNTIFDAGSALREAGRIECKASEVRA